MVAHRMHATPFPSTQARITGLVGTMLCPPNFEQTDTKSNTGLFWSAQTDSRATRDFYFTRLRANLYGIP